MSSISSAAAAPRPVRLRAPTPPPPAAFFGHASVLSDRARLALLYVELAVFANRPRARRLVFSNRRRPPSPYIAVMTPPALSLAILIAPPRHHVVLLGDIWPPLAPAPYVHD